MSAFGRTILIPFASACPTSREVALPLKESEAIKILSDIAFSSPSRHKTPLFLCLNHCIAITDEHAFLICQNTLLLISGCLS